MKKTTMKDGVGGCVYIVTNRTHSVLYTGVSSDLYSRMVRHIEKHFPKSFTARYSCNKLVYFRVFSTIAEAIAEEKRIKAGSRLQKIGLIENLNPGWRDLWLDVKNW